MKRHNKHKRQGTRKVRHSSRASRTKTAPPRTFKQFSSMSAQSQDRWTRMTRVITTMRVKGVSLPKASKEFGLDPRTVVRLGGSALRKAANGRYAAKPYDRLLRVLGVITPDGRREVAIRGSLLASLVAQHSNAIQKYLDTGDDSALRRLRRKTITDASGKRVRLLMDLEQIDILGSAGLLSFESLYARSA